MTQDPIVILICVAGIAAVAVLLLGCLCYDRCRGDAEMGVADTQGRCVWPKCEAWGCTACPNRWPEPGAESEEHGGIPLSAQSAKSAD